MQAGTRSSPWFAIECTATVHNRTVQAAPVQARRTVCNMSKHVVCAAPAAFRSGVCSCSRFAGCALQVVVCCMCVKSVLSRFEYGRVGSCMVLHRCSHCGCAVVVAINRPPLASRQYVVCATWRVSTVCTIVHVLVMLLCCRVRIVTMASVCPAAVAAAVYILRPTRMVWRADPLKAARRSAAISDTRGIARHVFCVSGFAFVVQVVCNVCSSCCNHIRPV